MVWQGLFSLLAENSASSATTATNIDMLDFLPVAVCEYDSIVG